MNPRFHNMKRLRTKTPTSLRQPSFAEAALLRMVLEARALGAVVVLGAIFAVGFVATTSVAQEVIVQEVINPDREASVKAVFLYSYGRYVTWPATFPAKGGPGKIEDDFVIGVLGDSAVIDKLERIAKKRTISGRPIRLLRVFVCSRLRRRKSTKGHRGCDRRPTATLGRRIERICRTWGSD